MLALPVATLAGVLIERDWDGLVQGIETAGATAAIDAYTPTDLPSDTGETCRLCFFAKGFVNI